MADAKLTGWFPPEVKPVHRGVYEVFDEGSYAYWSGKLWGWTVLSVASAAACRTPRGASQHKTWRGLAQQPLPANCGTSYCSCIECLKGKEI